MQWGSESTLASLNMAQHQLLAAEFQTAASLLALPTPLCLLKN
jgi:hypothetical protein